MTLWALLHFKIIPGCIASVRILAPSKKKSSGGNEEERSSLNSPQYKRAPGWDQEDEDDEEEHKFSGALEVEDRPKESNPSKEKYQKSKKRMLFFYHF